MNYTIRIARGVFEKARSDVLRTHAFAYERVGFLFGRTANVGREESIILLNDFSAVQDDHYIEDTAVGARIDSSAIRAALGRVLETGESCFHFHVHEHRGQPLLSKIDSTELDRLVPTFISGAPQAVHGAVIGSVDAASAWGWHRHAARTQAHAVALVGFPSEIWRPQ